MSFDVTCFQRKIHEFRNKLNWIVKIWGVVLAKVRG